MKSSHLPPVIRRRVKRAARKLRRLRRGKRELRSLAVHYPRFMPTGWAVTP